MLIDDGFAQLPTIPAASVLTPPAGFVKLFFDSSNANRLSQKDSSGAVIDLAQTSAGGGFTNTIVSATPIANQQDWSIAGLTAYSSVMANSSSVTDTSFIGGIVAGTDGQIIQLFNSSISDLFWLVNEDVDSVAANRFKLERSGAFLVPGQSITLQYSTTLSRWVQTNKSYDMLQADDKLFAIFAPNGTTVQAIGSGGATSTATLSTQAVTATPTNDFAESLKGQITNATANGSSDVRAAQLGFMRGATAGRQGIFFNARFRNTALGATGGFICGMTNSVAAITTQPRNTNNTFGVGTHGGETTHSLYTRDAAAANALDLGANFPANNATAAYEIAMLAMPNIASICMMIRRLDANFKSQFLSAANLPANTLGLAPRIGVMVGATAAANTAQFTRVLARSL